MATMSPNPGSRANPDARPAAASRAAVAPRDSDGEAARGYGAEPLGGVAPVLLGVHQVVDEVDGPAHRREDEERQRRLAEEG